MNKFILISFILVLISNCSLDQKTGLWSQSQKVKKEQAEKKKEKLFKSSKIYENEINANVTINLNITSFNKNIINNLNNTGYINFDSKIEDLSKYKFSKIKNFDRYEPELSLNNDSIIFFENKGSILKFDNNSKLIWKKNYYSKAEKKINPILYFAKNKNTLIVADNIAKYYAMDIKTGELQWSKNNSSSFNSQIKIYKDRFFVIDYDNVIHCFSIKNGNELWNVKTESSFIKSQKKLSIIVVDQEVIFTNSIGDISSVDINNGNLLWQKPTQNSEIYENAFLLKTSDLVSDNKSVIFSNNKNEFFSFDVKTGILKWKQKINSNLRPTLINELIFTVTLEGFLVIIENNTGNIIRITNIFDKIDSAKKLNIKPVGFVVGKKQIYLTTDNGRLITIDIRSGRSTSVHKIDNHKISRPFVINQKLFIIKDNAIIKIN